MILAHSSNEGESTLAPRKPRVVEVARRGPGRQGCRIDLPLLHGDSHRCANTLRRSPFTPKGSGGDHPYRAAGRTSAVEDEEVVQALGIDLIKPRFTPRSKEFLRLRRKAGTLPGYCFDKRPTKNKSSTQAPRAISSKAKHHLKARLYYRRAACEPGKVRSSRARHGASPGEASTQGGVNF